MTIRGVPSSACQVHTAAIRSDIMLESSALLKVLLVLIVLIAFPEVPEVYDERWPGNVKRSLLYV